MNYAGDFIWNGSHPKYELTDFKELEDAILKARMEYQKELERCLTNCVVAIEGFMPPPDDIKKYGRHVTYPDGRTEWTWKGTVMVIEKPPEWP